MAVTFSEGRLHRRNEHAPHCSEKIAHRQVGRRPQATPVRNGESSGRVPFLGYFRRSCTTLRNGTITGHGDGFMLTTIDPADADETKGIVLKPSQSDGLDILIGGEESIMSGSFTIGRSKWKFTYEPEAVS